MVRNKSQAHINAVPTEDADLQSNAVAEQFARGTSFWGCPLLEQRARQFLTDVSRAAVGSSMGLALSVMQSGGCFPRSASSSVKWAGLVTAKLTFCCW